MALAATLAFGLSACGDSGSTPRPVLAAVVPASGTSLGGDTVTIRGIDLRDSPFRKLEVRFDGSAASDVRRVDTETVSCVTPPGTAGTSVDVELRGPFGSDTLPGGYAYHPQPALISASIESGSSIGGALVALTGSGFLDNGAGLTTVSFGAVPALIVSIADDSTLTCEVPPGAPGATVDIVVSNANGSARLAGGFTYHPTPSLESLSIDWGTSLGGTAVTLTGTGFIANSAGANSVSFGGTPAADVVVIDDATLTCTTPLGPPATAVDVTVQNANGTTALASGFTYVATPYIESVVPGSGTSLGGVAMTITGTGFTANAAGSNTITIGGSAATNVVVVGDTVITCDAPAGPPGISVDVRVDNANGSGTLPLGFVYHPLPTITSVSPGSGTSLGGTGVTIAGSGFLDLGAGANAVTFGGVPATSVVVVDDTTITCVSPAGGSGVVVDVVVSNTNGDATLGGGFRYHAVPTLTTVMPPAGSPIGGLVVTLTGTGFQVDSPGAATVTFDGAPATGVSVVDDTTLTCTTPPGPDGVAVDVVVSNANGSATLVGGFIYNSTPLLVNVTPAQGTSLGGTGVTLVGTGFFWGGAGTNTVTFDGVPATGVVTVDDNTITCDTPSGTPGASVDVNVTNTNGSTTLVDGFQYHPLPILSAVTPASGTSEGGASVTLTGSNFLAGDAGTNAVTFGGVAATNVVVVNDATLTCDIPAGTPGAVVAVQVQNANGSAVLAGGFTYHPLPTITAVNPPIASSLGGISVTVTGSGFVANGAGANIVTFDGVPATNVVAVDDTTITCDTPPGTPEDVVDVEVQNVNGADTLASGFTYSPLPTVSSVAPPFASSLGGAAVTVTGTGFVANGAGTNVVTFDGAAATSVFVVDDTTLTCDVPAGPPGSTVDVEVQNTNGTGALPLGFSYHPTPTVTAVSPAVGTSLGGTGVTVTGTGFTANAAGASTVTFGGVAATGVVVVDDATITCTTPAGPAGTAVEVAVSNDNGSGALAPGFAYFPAPVVAGVSPAAGTSLGGTSVTVTGTGFTANAPGANTVTFGGVSASGVVVVDDATITCTTPAGPAGTAVDVTVSNDNGSGVLGSGFAYFPTPTVTAVSPAVGSALGGTSVTVTGTGFTANGAGINTVIFDGLDATGIVVIDDSTITCTTPAGTPGLAVSVAVTNDNGTGGLAAGYSYFPGPVLSSVSPSSGSSLGGTHVTLSGTGFEANGAGTNTVTFGGVAATSVLRINDTTITGDAPAGSPGTSVDVVVSNANGSSTAVGAFSYNAPPTLVSVTPEGGTSLGGTGVTLSGSGFVANGAGGNAVTFDGVAASTVVILNDTTITCTTPAGAAGAAIDVVVTNGNGSAILVAGYDYYPEPTVVSVSPPSGTSLGGTSVTVSGTGFTANAAGANLVSFGGVAGTGVVVVDDATITCTVPAGTAGASVDVVVVNDNGTGTLAGGFTYHDLPTLTGVSPASGTSLGGTGVTLTGSGFQDDAPGANAVTFAGVAAANVVVVDDTTMTCDTPAGSPGAAADVRVQNANGAAVLGVGFTYFPEPTVTGVTPSSGPWAGGTSVTITGTGFSANAAGACTVELDGVAATNVVVIGDGTITCDTPAGTPAAVVDVTVSNANGAGTLASGYRYFGPPSLASVSPAEGTSLGGTSVTLTGAGFQVDNPGTNTVTFGGVAATNVAVVSDSTITCETPAGPAATSVDVAISNANGSDTLTAGFTYYPGPIIASISPSSGGEEGGTAVTISGQGFASNSAGAVTVTFGGIGATNLVVLNDTTVTCDTPAGTAGTSVDIELSNANGAATVTDGFTYHLPPTLSSVTPASGSSLGSQVVTLTGTGFLANAAGANTVTFDGVAATEVVVYSDTSLSCETPAGTPGVVVEVELRNSNGSATLVSGFTYHALPTLTSVAPGAGTSLGGTSVTLTGTGFQDDSPGTNVITFGGVVATGVVVVSDTSITCDTPAGAAGATVDVVVTNDNGVGTLASGFTYHAEPTLASVSPASGSSLAPTPVTLTGTGFQANGAGANTVTFGGVAATNVVVVSDTSINCDAPTGAAGTSVDVVVTNTNGSATLASGFCYHAEPTLASVSPAAGSPAGGTSVTLTGTGFQDDAPGTNVVTFGGVAATNVSVVSDTSITCDAPAGAAGAFVDVILTNDNGSDTLVNAFTFYAEPVLTGVAPDHGPEGGGAAVTLTGAGFQDHFAGTNVVTFGGVAATGVAVVSDTTLTCDTPAGTAGTSIDVVVTNDNGSDTLTNGYSYNPPPTLTNVSPAAGTSLGGTNVTLTGTGFQSNGAGTNTVTFGGAAATGIVVGSDSSITCTVPAGTAGAAVNVVVTNTNGSATLAGGFSYHATPTVTVVTPGFGIAAGGTSVTFTGSGFLDNDAGTNSITIDGDAPTNVVVVDDSTITCDTPNGPGDTAVDVVISNANGMVTLAGGFRYNDPPSIGPVEDQWARAWQAFSYTPPSNDPDGSDTPVYTSTGAALPGWASLDPATGEISGTPGFSDVGVTTTGIVVSIDDGNYAPVASGSFDLAVSMGGDALTFDTPPQSNELQDEVWTPFTVRVEDSFGNLVGSWSNPVTLTVTAGSGTLSGTLVQPVVNGIATFDDLSHDTVETVTFDLTSPGVTRISGTSVTIDPGPATKLDFAVPPATVEYRTVVFSYFVVEVQDAAGNRVTTDNSTQVDLTLDSGTGTLSGTLSKTVVEGRAVFDDVHYDLAQTVALRATSTPATTSPVSEDIVVRPLLPSGLLPVRASVDSIGGEGEGASYAPAVSSNGRFLAFASDAANLDASDTNGVRDVFVHDRVTGETERVSVDSLGAQADGASDAPSLSADGRFVAFESSATNLVAGDSNAASDLFVHDRETGQTTRISVDSSGAQGNGESLGVAISANGRLAVFESVATDLVSGDGNASRDIFLHDRATGDTTRVSVDSLGSEASGDSTDPAISPDGRVVAFVSVAADLVAADTNAVADVFVHETQSAQTTRVSVATGGGQADGPSSEPEISGDGDVVAFTSTATNLIASDGNALADVFVRERGSSQTTRVSVTDDGGEANGASGGGSVSEDGDGVAFASDATNLVLGDSNANQDVFLRRRATARTIRLSTAAGGGGGDGASFEPVLSADGLHAGYASAASDLVAGDTNGVDDAFLRPVHDLPTATAVVPVAGTSLGGTAITITGTGFEADGAGGSSVFLDGAAATSVVTLNDTTITCDTPAGTGGATADVTVVNANGSGVLAGGFSYHPTPAVTAVNPVVGPTAGGTSVTVTGTGFASLGFGSNSVTFGGVAATNIVVVSDVTITCDTPGGTAGSTVDVSVTNLNGTGILSSAFSYHPAPTLTAVAPSSGHASGGDAMTLTGTGFTANGAGVNAVMFGGVPATNVVTVDDTTINCENPAGAAGTAVSVVVQNSNGAGTLTDGFTYNPEPQLTSVTPATGSPLGGTSVTLSGSGFQNNSVGTTSVEFGGIGATNVLVVSDTTITCDAPSGAAESTVNVTVLNGNGSSLLASAYTFNPEPLLSGVSPVAGTSLGGTSITLTGTGFQNTSSGTTTVTVDGASATNVVVVDDNTVTCDTPVGTPSTTVDVAVTNGNGSSVLVGGFAYHPTPTIASISPSGGALAGGTTVVLSGTGFVVNDAGTNTVTFAGVAATSLVVLNNTTVRCVTPASSVSGAVDVMLSNANGNATLAGGFSYNSAPTLSSVTPPAGSSLGGTAVTLTGTGFVDNGAGVNTVTFDGFQAVNVIAVSDTTITCNTPAGVAGAAVDVAVSNANDQVVLPGGFTYHPEPTATGISPAAGTSLGGTAVTVSGSGFLDNDAGACSVTIGGNPATGVVVVSDATITCVLPAGTAGATVDVIVTNANGSGTLAGGFSFHPTPTVSSVAPGVGSSLGGTAVTITGSGFVANAAGANDVELGGVDAANIIVVSDTTITCDTPAGTAGSSIDVVVQNANGPATLGSAFTYHPAPTLAAIVPGAGSGLGGTSITLTGTGFVSNDAGPATVLVDGAAATAVVVVDDTTITCETPAGTAGTTADVVVQNANGAATLGSCFDYHPAPTLTGVAPGTGSSLGGTSITLTGTGFVVNGAGPATVLVDGNPATGVSVVDDNTITCDTPAGAAGTTVGVVVQNANGSGSLASSFQYYPTPTLASVSPTDGSLLGGTDVTLSGTGFQVNDAGANTVTFDGNAAASVVVLNDNTITCTTPAGASGANVDVVVSNANGSGVGTGLFTYNASPTVISITPSAGGYLGGTSVEIIGTGFVNAGAGSNSVTIDGAPATDIVVVNDTTINCVVPAGTAGLAADVTVANDNGQGTLAGGFQYHPAPEVTAVTPPSGSMLGGTNLTITGSGFTANDAGTTSLTIGGVVPSNLVVVDDATITCDAPAGTPGAIVDVFVQNDNGNGLLVGGFRYHQQPTLTAVVPATGTSLGGASVTVSGAGFQDDSPGANAVTFGGIVATNVVVVNDTTLTCEAPAGTPEATVDVALSNTNGSAILVSAFSYHPLPTVTAVAPETGSPLGGSSVTITGTGFVANDAGANTVTVGGSAATNVVVLSDTTITCTTPAGTPGAAVEVVVSNDNGAGSLPSGFTYHPAPTVAGVVPPSGPGSGGTSVTLTGTGFVANAAGVNTVTFGGDPATNVVAVNDTTITCDTPSGTPGTAVGVVVSNDNGSGGIGSAFTYHPVPTVTAVDPPAGPPTGGTSVTLTGAGFVANAAGTNTVRFAGVVATNIVVVDDTTIQCTAPAGAPATDADLEVQNDNGTGTLPGGYRYRSDVSNDLDDDGVADLLIGAPSAGSGDGEAVAFLGDAVFFGDAGAGSADLRITPAPGSGASLGGAVSAGDLDGDGATDLVVGSPAASAVHVFFGPQNPPDTLTTSSADVAIDGVAVDDEFGTVIAVGDVDGDGQVDLIVGAPRTGVDDHGTVYVFFGGAGFAPANAGEADIALDGSAGELFGSAVAVGDLDGGGTADLVGGAPAVDRAYVFLGGAGLASGNTSGADATLDGAAAGDSFGSALALGDVGGGPRADIVVGAPLGSGGGPNSGAAYVFFGSATIVSRDALAADATVLAEGAGDRLGSSVKTGDMNGDGRPELVIGATHRDLDGSTTEVGRVYVFLGGTVLAAMNASSAAAHFTGEPTSGEHFGDALAVLDLGDDGFGDLVVGAPDADGAGADAGRVYVFLGGAVLGDELAASDDATFSGANPGDELGASVADD